MKTNIFLIILLVCVTWLVAAGAASGQTAPAAVVEHPNAVPATADSAADSSSGANLFETPDGSANKFALGAGYPYLSMKYRLSESFNLEAVGSFGTDIQIYGGRAYWIVLRAADIPIYTGLEANYIKFDSDEDKGSGRSNSIFAGAEYFLNKTFSVSLDFGPIYTSVKDNADYTLTTAGTDLVVNMGVYFNF